MQIPKTFESAIGAVADAAEYADMTRTCCHAVSYCCFKS